MRPYLRAANLTWGGIDIADVKQMNFEDAEVTTYRLHEGDLLLSEASGSPGEVGKPGVWRGQLDGDICFQNTLLRVRPEEGIDSDFLFFRLLFECLRGGFARQSRGVGIHHLGAANLSSLRIALPATTDQRRIAADLAASLPQLEVCKGALQALRARMTAARRSLLASMLMTPDLDPEESAESLRAAILEMRPEGLRAPASTNPASVGPTAPGWTVASLDALTEPTRKAAYGVLQPGPHTEDGVSLVRVGDVNGGLVATSGLKQISGAVAERFPRTELQGGELLITLVGTIGRTAVVPARLAGANVARAVGVVPLSPLVNARFIALALQAEPYAAALVGRSHEVARKTLNLEDVRSFPVPMPSRALQDLLVEQMEARLSQMDSMIEATKRLEQQIDRLRVSTLEAAFAPRDLAQVPASEHPSALVRSIAEARHSRLSAARKETASTVRRARTARAQTVEEPA